MGSWNGFYVKTAFDDLEAIKAIRASFDDAEIEPSEEWLGIRMPDTTFDAPEEELADLSARLKTEVIWLGLQSTVDALIFHHWKNGKRLRSLVHGCKDEGVWERVEGKAEPWERDVFFNSKDLKVPLQSAKTATEQRELRQLWKKAQLNEGSTRPHVHSTTCAHKIARIYGLPHYGR